MTKPRELFGAQVGKLIPDDVVDALAKSMQEDIDNEIMMKMLETDGWTVVKLDRFKDMKHPIDIKDWCDENISNNKKKGWTNFGPTFLFKEQKYAEWFILRWM